MNQHDVVIIGGGLAGLSLARHLLLESDKRILLIDKRAELPPKKQKVGESNVQVQGYYMAKVLDLEEHLQTDHFMKYNLRFLWPTEGRRNDDIVDYSQSYIRTFSNIACYQLDRNRFEEEMLRLNLASDRFKLCAGVSALEVKLDARGPHRLRFRHEDTDHDVSAEWVVDASGRQRFLARRHDLEAKNSIRHGSSWFWVDGLIDIDKLTAGSLADSRLRTARTSLGHLPSWLATNHFFAEGLWLWVIPLQGKTSVGLVYDKGVVDGADVRTPEKLIDWICAEFPLFERDLRQREVVDAGFLGDFSYDCKRTVSAEKWALTGEAGRFTDPLYSPGGDLIALHNTVIVDLITRTADADLQAACRLYEPLLKALYEAYVPSYDRGYAMVGDAETFALKYTWELTIYFGFYVFPFINDLFTDRRFVAGFLRRFARLGKLNVAVQTLLDSYYHWKKANRTPLPHPVFHDFTSVGHLRQAEKAFYCVGLEVDEAKAELDRQLANVEDLGQFIAAHVVAQTLGRPELVADAGFVEAIEPVTLAFDPAGFAPLAAAASGESRDWGFCLSALRQYEERGAGNEEPTTR